MYKMRTLAKEAQAEQKKNGKIGFATTNNEKCFKYSKTGHVCKNKEDNNNRNNNLKQAVVQHVFVKPKGKQNGQLLGESREPFQTPTRIQA